MEQKHYMPSKQTQAHRNNIYINIETYMLVCSRQKHCQPDSQSKTNVYTKESKDWTHTDRQTDLESH